jgi:hypothetical protein
MKIEIRAQDVARTPPPFLQGIAREFGLVFAHDLFACHLDAICPSYWGPIPFCMPSSTSAESPSIRAVLEPSRDAFYRPWEEAPVEMPVAITDVRLGDAWQPALWANPPYGKVSRDMGETRRPLVSTMRDVADRFVWHASSAQRITGSPVVALLTNTATSTLWLSLIHISEPTRPCH